MRGESVPVTDEVMIIYAAAKGYVDKVPRSQVAAWEQQFQQFMREQRPDVRNKLLRDEQKGTDVKLTIDLRLQRAADDALGNDRGAIAAINVRTGEVLALASHPYFDPNTLDDRWSQLSQDPAQPFVARLLWKRDGFSIVPLKSEGRCKAISKGAL